jgi:hypothetical protein
MFEEEALIVRERRTDDGEEHGEDAGDRGRRDHVGPRARDCRRGHEHRLAQDDWHARECDADQQDTGGHRA